MLKARLQKPGAHERPTGELDARGDRLDETLEDSFPASDPIPHSPTRSVGEKPRPSPPPS